MNAFDPFNIEEWLGTRATSTKLVGQEILFTHKDGSTSVLLPRSGQAPEDLVLLNSPMSWFYKKYRGASIGSSHVMIAVTEENGIEISQGFCLPDRKMLTSTVESLGIRGKLCEVFFAVEAAWMFAYAMNITDTFASLIRYDRDMNTFEPVYSLQEVLEDWWSLVCADD